ncbi:MAG: TetR/AcrR family transcriptional regulator [Acidimicrobiales bacterium]
MSPRSYNLGRRQDQIDDSRRQILDGARALLREAPSYSAFTLDAVAKRADVARGTVYYQFGSKAGLLEAVCDDLGDLGGLAQLPEAFSEPDPKAALARFVACFARFWQADRAAMRRLRALAALDPDVQAVIDARDQRRHQGLEVLVARLAERGVERAGTEADRVVATLQVLTSFETFHGLARPDQPLDEVAADVMDLIGRFLDAQ